MVDLEKLAELHKQAFRAPWTYDRWEVECEACDGGSDVPESGCPDPDCDGTHAPLTCIESPEEYPDGQVVAQFKVPGLLSLADKNGALIVELRNQCAALIAELLAARELATHLRWAAGMGLAWTKPLQSGVTFEMLERYEAARDGGGK